MPRVKTRGLVQSSISKEQVKDRAEELRQSLAGLATETCSKESCVAKYGFDACLEFRTRMESVSFNWPESIKRKFTGEIPAEVRVAFQPDRTTRPCQELSFIGPPVGACIHCEKMLQLNNKPTTVRFYTSSGQVLSKQKVSLRCPPCNLTYHYSTYGNSETGFQYYTEPRDAVEANERNFFARELMAVQFSFSQHCWVSFEGFTEAWKDAHSLTRDEVFDRRVLADAFWAYNLEEELRDLQLQFFFKVPEDRERAMTEVDAIRQKTLYPHPAEECHEACRARGCGKLWITDGIWKTQFSHCMWQMKVKSGSVPTANLPTVCTNGNVPGKAFCTFHCKQIEERNCDVPTGLREFNKFCKVDDTDGEVESAPAPVVRDHSYACTAPSTCLSDQGGQQFIADHSSAVGHISHLANAKQQGRCQKDLGERNTLRRMSRGHQFIVRAGGHIDTWTPLYQSESVGQVFLIILSWLYCIVKNLPVCEWGKIWLAYDNMCQLVKCRASNEALPLTVPYKHMWQRVHKIVDALHIKNHVDPNCHTDLHPDNIYEAYPDLQGTRNTQAGEQTFVWLGRFKKIVCSMPKCHHLFFIHRMVKHRNKYNAVCYAEGRKPLLPSLRNGMSQ